MFEKCFRGFLQFCADIFSKGVITFVMLIAIIGCGDGGYDVSVTYGGLLDSTVAWGGEDKTRQNQIIDCFSPFSVEDTATEVIRIVPFRMTLNARNLTTERVAELMAESGLRPALPEELLYFVKSHPNFQRTHMVVALGSLCDFRDRSDGDIRKHALAVNGDEDHRYVFLAPDYRSWDPSTVFLAVDEK